MKILIYILTILLLLANVFVVKAHESGEPFVKVNGDYPPTNPLSTYTFPEHFEIGSDVASPSAFLVNKPLKFEVDIDNFANPYELEVGRDGSMRRLPESDVPQPVFRWDFGDDSSAKDGLEVDHTYKKPGTYIVDLQVKYPKKNDKFGTINTIQINILPQIPYNLPQARIKVNNKTISNPGEDVVEIIRGKNYTFTAESSIKNIEKYVWDFNDGSVVYGASVKHKFTDKDLIAIYPTLRIVDKNNIAGDTFVSLKIIENKSFFHTLFERMRSIF